MYGLAWIVNDVFATSGAIRQRFSSVTSTKSRVKTITDCFMKEKKNVIHANP